MAHPAHRAGLTLALAIAALCGAVPSAPAATVSFTPTLSDSENPTVIGHGVGFAAGAGETNAVTVTEAGGAVTIREASLALAAPPGCQQLGPRAVLCRPTAGPLTVGMLLADGNDSALLSTSIDGVYVDGGVGNDLLVGGAGDDKLDGDAGNDLLAAGAGDDLLEPGVGSDVLHGGAGADSARYTARDLPISVDLSVPRADGVADPPDSLTSIEGATGGNGRDELSGDGGANSLDGNVGGDRLVGGGGPDELIGWEGPDRIDAGAGDDRIDLSVFEPPAESGDGQYAIDEHSDRVRCGTGRDSVWLPDVSDSLASDCELVAWDFIVLRPGSVRLTRRHLVVRVASRVAGSRQRIWLTIKRGGHTTLLGRSAPRRRAGNAHIRLNSNGLKLFDDRRKHRIRLGDDLDPDAGFSVRVGR